ncbi:MAG: hypothetical protein ABI579_05215 [Candidatus Sumerlaeota bacterium]
MHRLTRNNIILMVTILVCFSPVLLLYLWDTSEPRYFKAQKGSPFPEGAAIREALKAYRADMGSYPNQLAALVPRFIEAVPSPKWGGDRWSYRPEKPDDYTLSVSREADGRPTYFIHSGGKWQREN